ncbi:chaperone modulator CbpM [Polaromonas naphthalenivorans]|uniref:Transcriptional regulator, MerR family n=1 Tax=Polaromonas naphthalenivorans (strain CJ2) TaxID=365044 RepID=A1VPF1_POLNA|nr:chaperone modulator CbpM [Polaromonas naphthalenivorans]ABM37529.1 transcriptional regulator, MerR family [Polaromonas naphthalenivorans CJ2]
MTTDFQLVSITGLILEEQTGLSLDDLCRACAAQADRIIELVNEGVLAPAGNAPDDWRFTGLQLQRARVALRLEADLGVNLAGAALALELLDELDSIRTRLRLFEGK